MSTPIDPTGAELPPPRRRFFRQAMKSLFDTVEEVARWQKERFRLDPGAGRSSEPRFQLRPPGALPEEEFVHACQRTGECVAACPVQAIQVLQAVDPRRQGTPYLVASERACVVCEDLSCMKACPSGALTLLSKFEIRMGIAIVEESLCLRSFGHDCTECVDLCPLGEKAIRVDGSGRIEVLDPGCVGCGVCEYYCPTAPRAIRVIPE